jgi:hypothetical protein
MQTFLTHSEFAKSANSLDERRLHNQLNEFRVLRKAILGGPKTPWAHHPAAIMWHGHLGALCQYALAIAQEMQFRGMPVDVQEIWSYARECPDIRNPAWLGDHEFHILHRRNLVRKNPEVYWHWGLQPLDVYIWPIEATPGMWIMRKKQVGAKKYEDFSRILFACGEQPCPPAMPKPATSTS